MEERGRRERKRGGEGQRDGGSDGRSREEAGGADGGVSIPGHLQRAAAGGGRAQQQLPQGYTHADTHTHT